MNILDQLNDVTNYLTAEINSLRLDIRHIQDQTTDYNARLIKLTLKVDKCINQNED